MQFKKKGKREGRNARDGIFVHASGMKIELFDFLIFIAKFPFFLHSLSKKETAHWGKDMVAGRGCALERVWYINTS